MKYLQIRDHLFLVQQEINTKPEETKEEVGRTNHIWIYDRSGSMYDTLPDLVQDLIVRAKKLPVGDTITIGWFSGEGKFNFILKGFKIADDSDYAILEQAIRNNSTTVDLTCFSEILAATKTITEDLQIFSNRFALCFFTDGYPVVSSYPKEKIAIFKAIKEVSPTITASLLVGYGNYYNKELMSQMAEAFGGSLTHSDNLEKFDIALTDFVTSSVESDRISVDVLEFQGASLLFSLTRAGVNIYQPDDKGSISFTVARGRGKEYLYALTTTPKGTEVKFTDANVQNGKAESLVKGSYAAALVLLQRMQSDVALEVLGTLGDKALIDITSNAFTNDEYGVVEKRLQSAISEHNKRFINGRSTSHLPKEDAFCLLDAVDLLLEDPNAYFYPQHPAFQYKRIGVPSVTKEGYPDFVANSGVKCPFASVTWNEKMLNLSVLTRFDGKIKLRRNYKEKGFKELWFPTWIYRNYAIVRDGFPNVEVLPMSMSEVTFLKLWHEGMIDQSRTWKEDEVYEVYLTKVPVMNRAIAKGHTSAVAFFENTYKMLQLQASVKVLKYLKTSYDTAGVFVTRHGLEGLTSDQIEYLKEHGVTNNGFNPPKEDLAATDSYYAKVFTVSMSGLSSLPKVEDVIHKVTASKKLTPREQLLQPELTRWSSAFVQGANISSALAQVDSRLKKLQKELATLRAKVQRTKFAIILGNKWFDEFTSRENNSMTLGDITYTITLKEDLIPV